MIYNLQNIIGYTFDDDVDVCLCLYALQTFCLGFIHAIILTYTSLLIQYDSSSYHLDFYYQKISYQYDSHLILSMFDIIPIVDILGCTAFVVCVKQQKDPNDRSGWSHPFIIGIYRILSYDLYQLSIQIEHISYADEAMHPVEWYTLQ